MNLRQFIRTGWLFSALTLGWAAVLAGPVDADNTRSLARPDSRLPATNKPVKVFILMGQSNMVGMGDIEPDTKSGTLTHLIRTDKKYPFLVDGAGNWTAPKNVYYYDARLKKGGYLSATSNNGKSIGPELGFGYVIGQQLDAPVLIIKSCIGNRSLGWDLLPPGSKRYTAEVTERSGKKVTKTFAGYKDTPDFWIEGQPTKTNDWYAGKQYDVDLSNAKTALGNLSKIYPDYQGQGYEIAGFVWHQAWNDWCDSWWYPAEWGNKRFDEYGRLMAMFIRDVRKDLSAPKMPFVIGVAGFDGLKAGKDMQSFRKAMASPSLLPEFKGNVFAVQTAPFWDDKLATLQARVEANWPKVDAKVREEKNESWENKMKHMSANFTPEEWKHYQHNGSNAGYHYLGCAKTFALMGKAFAEATVNLQRTQEQEK